MYKWDTIREIGSDVCWSSNESADGASLSIHVRSDNGVVDVGIDRLNIQRPSKLRSPRLPGCGSSLLVRW